MAGIWGTWIQDFPGPFKFSGGGTSVALNDVIVHCGGDNVVDATTAPFGVSTVIGINTYGMAPKGVVSTNVFVARGADYAEYFEWADGNVEEEDRVGYAVQYNKLNPGMIEKYHYDEEEDNEDSSGDDDDDGNNKDHMKRHVIGIVSGTAGVVGDDAPFMWHGTNTKDEFGRDIVHYSWKLPIVEALMLFINVQTYK